MCTNRTAFKIELSTAVWYFGTGFMDCNSIGNFQILRFGIALFKSNCISDFHHCYIQHLHCWKSDPNSTEDHRFSKNFSCGRQIYRYTFLKIKWLSPLLHCWKSAPNPTEDHKSSKKFACGGQFNILSSKLNGSHSCYIAGKVLQIQPNIANP